MFLILYHLILYSLFGVFQQNLQKSLYEKKNVHKSYLDDFLCFENTKNRIPSILTQELTLGNVSEMINEIKSQSAHIKLDKTNLKNLLTSIESTNNTYIHNHIYELESIRKQRTLFETTKGSAFFSSSDLEIAIFAYNCFQE